MNKLIEAAKAVDFAIFNKGYVNIKNPKDAPILIALRQAVQEAETYKPMTDDELEAINSSFCLESGVFISNGRAIERATIERQGLKWGVE